MLLAVILPLRCGMSLLKNFFYDMKRCFLLILFELLICGICNAVPAYPFPVFIDTSTGRMQISLRGDEWMKYAVTDDGYPLLQTDSGWFFARVNEEGLLCPSEFQVASLEKRNKQLREFLQKESSQIRNRPVRDLFSMGKAMSPLYNNVDSLQCVGKRVSDKAIIGERKALVILVQFKDVAFSKSRDDFDRLFNQQGYADDGAKGSVRDFYSYASYGKLQMHGDVIGPFTLANPMAYYGGNVGWGSNDRNPYAMFEEAVSLACEAVNLAEYDQDDDGYLDNVHIIFAGYGEEAGASSDAIWSHELQFTPVTVNGMMINRYSCAPELRGNSGGGISRIGPHCHEIGHALGAADYYDTDYDAGGSYLGTGAWDVMASGSWNEEGVSPANFNPYVKAFGFGWCEVMELSDSKDLKLMPSSVDDRVFSIHVGNGDECFLLENRQQYGFDSSVPGHGLLVYHIGDGIGQSVVNNKVNATYPQCCYIVCASSEYRAPSSVSDAYGQINGGGCPFPGESCQTEFGLTTVPGALCTDGTWAGFSFADICEHDDGSVIMSVKIGETEPATDLVAAGDTVWHESFTGLFIPPFWTQTVIEGGGRWEMARSVSLMDNNCWLQLSPVLSPFEKAEKVVTRLESSPLELDSDEYVLSLNVACCSNGAKGIDDVSVNIFCNGQPVKEYEYNFKVYSEKWTTHSFCIGKDCLPLQFSITGTCYNNSILKIDDIVIRRRHASTAIKNAEALSRQGYIYDIDGVCLGSSRDISRRNTVRNVYIKGGKKYVAR